MKSTFELIIKRLNSDFQLSVICVLAGSVTVAITPFAIYRLLNGQMLQFVVDVLIIVLNLVCLIYAWRSGKSDVSALVMSSVLVSGFIASCIIDVTYIAYWFYAIILLTFALVPARNAFILVSIGIVVFFFVTDDFPSMEEKFTYVTTVFSAILFAYIFSYRNAKQREKLTVLANTDQLTKIGNRRAYDDALRKALNDYRHSSSPMAIAIFDVDYFKQINDKFGHEEGDKVLVGLAKIVCANTYSKDKLFRVGGEEFCLLLENTNTDATTEVIEKLRELIESSNIIKDFPVTTSVGATQVSSGDTVDSWVKRADKAMYQAKSNGRNCCVFL